MTLKMLAMYASIGEHRIVCYREKINKTILYPKYECM